MELYQCYNNVNGLRFRHRIAKSKEQVIEDWQAHFGTCLMGMTEKEVRDWLENVAGLNYQKLSVEAYTAEEYIQKFPQDLSYINFNVYSSTEHQGSFPREMVIDDIQFFREEVRKDHIADSYAKDCVGYLDELEFSGYYSEVVDYLQNNGTEGLSVGWWFAYYAYNPVPADTWLSWAKYAEDEIRDTSEKRISMIYSDEVGEFVDYPFGGESFLEDEIRNWKKHEKLRRESETALETS